MDKKNRGEQRAARRRETLRLSCHSLTAIGFGQKARASVKYLLFLFFIFLYTPTWATRNFKIHTYVLIYMHVCVCVFLLVDVTRCVRQLLLQFHNNKQTNRMLLATTTTKANNTQNQKQQHESNDKYEVRFQKLTTNFECSTLISKIVYNLYIYVYTCSFYRIVICILCNYFFF